MRIDIVTDTFPPDINGVAMTLQRLTSELRALHHHLTIYHTGTANSQREKTMKSWNLPGYPEVKIGLPATTYWINRWQRKRPDVIYVATESPMGISALKVARNIQIPTAAGFHTNFHQYIDTFQNRKIELTALQYLRKAHSKANITIAPSMEVKDMLEDNGFQNIRIMGRGVDTNLFHLNKRCKTLRSNWGAQDTDLVFLTVGRISSEKNLELGIRAYQHILHTYPTAKYILVGDGPARKELQQNHPNLIFTGTQRYSELARHYASADILLFPSETETFGNVLLEGKASGLITVAYDYAAAKQHTRHTQNGYTVPKGKEQQFIETALTAASLDLTNTNIIAREARHTAEALSWSSTAETFQSHLREIIQQGKAHRRAKEQRVPLKVRTLILSDIHLGSEDSKAREIVDVLKHTQCERIILNGDIIDGWALKRGNKWKNIHTRVIRTLLSKMEKEKVEIIYLRGNHDEFLEKIIPLTFSRITFTKEYLHTTSSGKKYLVIHGDGYDSLCAKFRGIELIGAIGYDSLLRLNRVYNQYRAWRGKEYFSLSKAIKSKVKSTLSFIASYEAKLAELAKAHHCHGIICGHIHTPADKIIEGIHYINSGDWVETLSGAIENHNGQLEVFHYEEFLQKTTPRLWKNQAPQSNITSIKKVS